MTIEKRGKSSYRITEMVNGVKYRITVDHKPSRDEAIRLLAKQMEKKSPSSSHSTFKSVCDTYIESKRNILSVSTIDGYKSILRRIPDSFMKLYIEQITHRDVQKLLNDYSKDHSPKTVANLSNFIMSVLKYNDINISSPTLPQRVKKEVYIPTTEEVGKILKIASGTKYEVAFYLAANGLRRSEILAITADKVNGNKLTIDEALVQDEDNEWVTKTTKTTGSTREIIIPDHIADIIRRDGKAYTGSARMLNQTLYRYQNNLGLPRFSFHKMRHFFASYMHQLGYTDSQIMDAGGWETDHVMKEVYRHSMKLDEAKSAMCADISKLADNG